MKISKPAKMDIRDIEERAVAVVEVVIEGDAEAIVELVEVIVEVVELIAEVVVVTVEVVATTVAEIR